MSTAVGSFSSATFHFVAQSVSIVVSSLHCSTHWPVTMPRMLSCVTTPWTSASGSSRVICLLRTMARTSSLTQLILSKKTGIAKMRMDLDLSTISAP
eukprot:6046192-Prymnesium_polylepis.1